MIIEYERKTLPPIHRRFEAKLSELNHALIFILIEALDTAKYKDSGGWVPRSAMYLDLSKPSASREMSDQVIEVLVELGFLTFVPDYPVSSVRVPSSTDAQSTVELKLGRYKATKFLSNFVRDFKEHAKRGS